MRQPNHNCYVIKRAPIMALLLLLSGCQLLPITQSDKAIIPVHSPESLVELRRAVKSLLNDRDVLVSASAFTKSNRLLLQQQPIRGPGGRIIDTLVDEEPLIFHLYLEDGQCYVQREGFQKRIRLTRPECIPN